jgi:hypothetical protein
MKNKTLWFIIVLLVIVIIFLFFKSTISGNSGEASVFVAQNTTSTTQPKTTTAKPTTQTTKPAVKPLSDIDQAKVCGLPLEACLSKSNVGYIMNGCRKAEGINQATWTSDNWKGYFSCVADETVNTSPSCTRSYISCLRKF